MKTDFSEYGICSAFLDKTSANMEFVQRFSEKLQRITEMFSEHGFVA